MPTVREIIQDVIYNTDVEELVTKDQADKLVEELAMVFSKVPMSTHADRPVGPRMNRRFGEQPGFMTYNSQTRPLIEDVTTMIKALAQTIGECVPDTRHKELALEALETVQLRSRRAFDQTEPSVPRDLTGRPYADFAFGGS